MPPLGTGEEAFFAAYRLEMELKAQEMKAQDRALVQGPESRALYLERGRARANVVAQCLCKPSGTDRSADDNGCVGSMESKQQQDEAVSGGSGGVGTASCFPGSELQVGSRADVARADATISNGESGGLMGSERQQQGRRLATQGGRFEGAGGPCRKRHSVARAPSRVSGECGSGGCDG